MPLGNDIVDLQEARTLEKTRDARFLARVFSPAEQTCLREAQDPALTLWLLWSAKESLFKCRKKLEPALVFSHAAFSVSAQALQTMRKAPPTGALHEQADISIQWAWNADYIHCVAFTSQPPISRVSIVGETRGTLNPQEEESVHSQESREVRLLAKQLLRDHHSLLQPEIVRTKEGSRFLPPEAREAGQARPELGISLSHDGRYIAAAVSRLGR